MQRWTREGEFHIMRRLPLPFLVVIIPLSLPACSQPPSPAAAESPPAESSAAHEKPAKQEKAVTETPAPSGKSMDEIQEEQEKRLMAIPGVVGMGQGLSEGKRCFRVYVDRLTPELSEKIPTTIEGYPVVVIQTGQIKKF